MDEEHCLKLNKEELARIAGRAEKATPGPWTFGLIAAAREDIPRLLASHGALEAQRDALRSELEQSRTALTLVIADVADERDAALAKLAAVEAQLAETAEDLAAERMGHKMTSDWRKVQERERDQARAALACAEHVAAVACRDRDQVQAALSRLASYACEVRNAAEADLRESEQALREYHAALAGKG